MTTEHIRVIPRADRRTGEAILFLPDMDERGPYIGCYQHIGQHGIASLAYYWQDTIEIRDDLSVERAGFFRAYTSDSLDAPACCPLIGLCDPRGSHRTVRAVADQAHRMCPHVTVYRNGRKIRDARGDA